MTASVDQELDSQLALGFCLLEDTSDSIFNGHDKRPSLEDTADPRVLPVSGPDFVVVTTRLQLHPERGE